MGDNSLGDPEHLSVSSVKFCVATHGKLCHGLFTEVLVSPSGPKETWRRGLYVDGIFVICNLFSFFFFLFELFLSFRVRSKVTTSRDINSKNVNTLFLKRYSLPKRCLQVCNTKRNYRKCSRMSFSTTFNNSANLQSRKDKQ